MAGALQHEPAKLRTEKRGNHLLSPAKSTRVAGCQLLSSPHERHRQQFNRAGCPGSLRTVRRALRAGDADAPAPGIGAGIFPVATGPGVSAGTAILPAGILRPADAALFRRTPHAGTRRGEDL